MADVSAAEKYREFFAGVFALMDAEPKARKVKVFAEKLTIDVDCGNPVFSAAGESAVADFRRRWIAEHRVPFTVAESAVFSFTPTTGNRVKVRIR